MSTRNAIARFLHRAPPVYRAARRSVELVNARRPPRFVEGVGPVHRNDLMYDPGKPWSAQHYAESGRQVAEFLVDNGVRDGASILDFGCGYGRVTRVLARQFPSSPLSACDLDAGGVAFCAAELGAIPVAGNLDPERLALGTYDVVWMGSVLTHLDRPTATSLVRRLAAVVQPGGLLAFSTHGRRAERDAAALTAAGGTTADGVTAELDATGWSYRGYPHHDGYGLTWLRPEAVRDLVAGCGTPYTSVDTRPDGWGGWQDLWAFRRDT